MAHVGYGYQIGYYGIPGEPASRLTKVHLLRYGKPVCGCRLSPKQEFQWCADKIVEAYIECGNCRRIAERILAESYEMMINEFAK